MLLLIARGPEIELGTGSSGASSCRTIYLLIKDQECCQLIHGDKDTS